MPRNWVNFMWQYKKYVAQDRHFAQIPNNMTKSLDEIDRQMLAVLAENARLPVSTIASKIGVARTTVQHRLERMERDGTIAGYAVRLSDEAQEAQIRATVLVQVAPRSTPMVLSGLAGLMDVEVAHTTSGRFDLALLLRAQSTAHLDVTLDQIGALEGVHSLESLIHLSTRIDRAF